MTLPPAASGTIHIDPGQGTWQAIMSTISIAAAAGDFSPSAVPILDLATCQQLPAGVACSPFPASIVPLSRADPLESEAAQLLTSPNSTVPRGSINGYITESGALPADGHFVVTAPTLVQPNEPAYFGAFHNLGAAAAESYTVSFYLFADGLQLDSKTVTAQIY